MKITQLLSTLAALLLCCTLSFAQTPDPGLPGAYTVLKAEYNLGDTSLALPSFPNRVEVRGSVHYPATLGAGPFPVIVFLHGRHSTCYNLTTHDDDLSWPCPTGEASITSYEGYDYMARIIASHGYIVISISCNAINADDNSLADYGMQARAELMQHHLDLWNIFNTTGAAPFDTLFRGRLDMKNIGTMGHSRGGEGVIYHALYNQSLGSPYGIKAVVTLAPVDFNRRIMHNIPLLNVAPYCDGDVSNIQGVHFYDDARYTDSTDEAPKHSVLFMGANHNFFNTVWTPGSYVAGGADDWDDYQNPSDIHCGTLSATNKRFDSTKQKAAITAYMSAFYRLYMGHENAFAPILNVDDVTAPASSLLDSTNVYMSYHPGKAHRLDVNRTDSTTDYTINSLADSVTQSALTLAEICGGGFTMPDCDPSFDADQQPHEGDSGNPGLAAMRIKWADTNAYYQNDIPAGDENLGAYQNLQFRATYNRPSVASSIGKLDFNIELTDSAGNKSSVPVGNYTHVLFRQPGATFGELPKLMFNTIKVPLSDFSGVDLAKIRSVRFMFDRSVAGSIIVSDICMTSQPCSGIIPAFTDSVTPAHTGIFTNTTAVNSADSLTWKWNFGDPSTGVNDTSTLRMPPHHIYSSHGTYNACLYVTAYRKNDYICTDSLCKAVNVAGVGIAQQQESEITITPNPAKTYLHITGAHAADVLSLINLYGQVIFTIHLTQGDVQLPKNIAPGIYYAVITMGDSRIYKKILITQ